MIPILARRGTPGQRGPASTRREGLWNEPAAQHARPVGRGRHTGPAGQDSCRHRLQYRPGVRDRQGARRARRHGRAGLPRPRQGQRRGRPDSRRRAGRCRPHAPARPRLPGLGPRRRRAAPGRLPAPGPAHQQRRRDDAALQPDRGRLRAPVRHQPSRPLRAHRPATGPAARHPGVTGGDGQQRRPPDGRHLLRRPCLYFDDPAFTSTTLPSSAVTGGCAPTHSRSWRT
jgi:hypothetical protein